MGFPWSQQADEGGDDPEGDVVDGQLLEPRQQSPALLGPPHEALDDVPLAVRRLIEVGGAGLVFPGGDDAADPAAAQPTPDAGVAFPLGPRQSPRPAAPTPAPTEIHPLHGRLESAALMPLAGRDMDAEHRAPTITEQVDLGTEAAP